jgi:hypothetical protein
LDFFYLGPLVQLSKKPQNAHNRATQNYCTEKKPFRERKAYYGKNDYSNRKDKPTNAARNRHLVDRDAWMPRGVLFGLHVYLNFAAKRRDQCRVRWDVSLSAGISTFFADASPLTRTPRSTRLPQSNLQLV